MSADVGVYDESPSNDSDARPTISLFEQWEEGAHVPRVANARDYSFPKSLVIPYTWQSASQALCLSLSDALNHVSLHDERTCMVSSNTHPTGTTGQLSKSTPT